MPTAPNSQVAGDYLASQHAARRPLDVMAQTFAPKDEAEAYAVQRVFLTRLSAETGGGKIAGYKIAYTNAVMRERAGIFAPCSGLMLAFGVRESPAALSAADYVRLGIECEVAVGLSADLPAGGAPYTLDAVSDAIDWLAASFELVDGREAADGVPPNPALRAIATNISNAGAVLGERVRDWRGVDLAASYGAMRVNGETVGDGRGADVMGHPLNPLVWLANDLAARGESLSAGMIVLTGSFAPPFMLNAGDAASVSIEGLGEATLTVGD